MSPERSNRNRIPQELRSRHDDIVAITNAIAEEHLDTEYRDLCRRMAGVLARMQPSPIERGTHREWAAGIVHAIGSVNFLDDPSQSPHLRTAQLASAAGVGTKVPASISRRIRSLLAIVPHDIEWMLPSSIESQLPTMLDELANIDDDVPFRASNSVMDDVMREMHAEIERTLARDAFASIDDVNAALAAAAEKHNRTPQPDLGGLTPENLRRLLAADWESDTSALRVDGSLTLAELEGSRTFHDARLLLEILAKRGRVNATPKGNLPRTVVAEFRERMRPPADSLLLPLPEQRVWNEEDLWHSLHVVRVVCELAGLLRRSVGIFVATRRGRQLRDDARAGELFALLVRTHFRVFELSYADRAPEAPDFQATLGYGMYRLAKVGGVWHEPDELAPMLILPEVREEIPTHPLFDESVRILETRLLRPLEGFGLAELRKSPRKNSMEFSRFEYRKSPLFDRVMRFRIK